MSNKYIIKNCPCFWHIGEDNGCSLENMKLCKDDTNCIMKQIVELLKSPNNCRYSGKPLVFTNDILPLLDIEECE